jgi:exodeoxyribonuclease VII small subunit
MGEPRDPSDPASGAPAAAAEEPGFEAALARLEALVETLERGDLALEGALACFEEGVSLARRCAAQLDEAERRIDVLVRDGDEWTARPLAASEEGEGE